ncbi:MAG TPA: hypothetical protein VIH40_02830, partial [Xanthobacteraceae bacterium]
MAGPRAPNQRRQRAGFELAQTSHQFMTALGSRHGQERGSVGGHTMTSMHVNRRALLAGSAAIAASGALVRGRPAAAAAPKTGQQVPGLHRVTVGDIEVTAVLDGHLDIPANMFPKADPPGIERLQKDAFAPLGDKLRAPVNGYLVNTGDKLILVDGGTGGRLGPTAGRLADNLKAAGIA